MITINIQGIPINVVSKEDAVNVAAAVVNADYEIIDSMFKHPINETTSLRQMALRIDRIGWPDGCPWRTICFKTSEPIYKSTRRQTVYYFIPLRAFSKLMNTDEIHFSEQYKIRFKLNIVKLAQELELYEMED